MLSCKDVTEKLSADIDDELTVLERLSVRFHQFICSDCKQAAQNMRALVISLKDRPPVLGKDEPAEPVSEEYVDRIMATLEAQRKNPDA